MSQLRKLPPWLIVIPAALVLFYPLFTGEALFWGLPAMQFVPWQQFAYEELAAGRLPLWNPYAGAGAPLVANYQLAFFYPPNWMHALLPAHLGLAVLGVLHLVWAAWGMWAFTGALEVPAFGRTVSALAFAFSGTIVARFGTPPMVYAAAWLPWLFWAVRAVMVGRRPRRAVGLLALVAGMQLLTGHAQLTFYALVGAGLYALWLGGLKRLLLAAAGVLLGAATAAIQLLPTLELLRTSQRAGGLDYDFLMNFSYGPLRVLSQLTPHFFGTPAAGTYQGKGAYWEDAAYIGLLPLVLALLAVFAWLKRRRREGRHPALAAVPFFALMGVGAFVLALGKYAPFGLYDFLYYNVPTFAMFQGPARWLILHVFALSVLAGVGTVAWGRGKWTFYFSRLATAGGVGIVGLALLAPNYIPENAALEALAAAMVALGSWMAGAAILTLAQPDPEWRVSPRWWQAAVILFIAVDLVWAWQGINPTVPAVFYNPIDVEAGHGRAYWFDAYHEEVAFDEESGGPAWFRFNDFTVARESWRQVRRAMLPNMNMLDDVPLLNNFDPMQPGHYVRYLEQIEAAGPEDAGPLLRAAGVDVVYAEEGPAGWVEDADTPGRWFAPEPALRAWVAESADSVSEVGAAEIVEAAPQRVRVQVDVPGEDAAYLVLADTWYPGWEAAVDGAPAEVRRANMAFRAVQVPAGAHEVVFTYNPPWLLPGALLSLAGLVGCGVLLYRKSRHPLSG